MQTQKLNTYYLWFSVLVVNSGAWSFIVTVKLIGFAGFLSLYSFLVGCYKGDFLAAQLTSWIHPCVSNVSCDPKGFQLEWF